MKENSLIWKICLLSSDLLHCYFLKFKLYLQFCLSLGNIFVRKSDDLQGFLKYFETKWIKLKMHGYPENSTVFLSPLRSQIFYKDA